MTVIVLAKKINRRFSKYLLPLKVRTGMDVMEETDC